MVDYDNKKKNDARKKIKIKFFLFYFLRVFDSKEKKLRKILLSLSIIFYTFYEKMTCEKISIKMKNKFFSRIFFLTKQDLKKYIFIRIFRKRTHLYDPIDVLNDPSKE